MGYTTEFEGKIEITPAVTSELIEYINQFGNTRRMKRNSQLLQEKYMGENSFNGSYGIDGEYFIGGDGFMGQDRDNTVLDNNNPPSTQPGLWCQWEISEDGKYIQWDGNEKFYNSVEWMKYIIDNFLNGYVCHGQIEAQGEEFSDHWMLVVKDNAVEYKTGNFVWNK